MSNSENDVATVRRFYAAFAGRQAQYESIRRRTGTQHSGGLKITVIAGGLESGLAKLCGDVLGGDMIRLAHAEQVIRRLSNLAAQVSGVERDDRRALLVSYAASRSSSEPSPRLQSHV